MNYYLGSYGEPDHFDYERPVKYHVSHHSRHDNTERLERRRQRDIERQVSHTSGLYINIFEELAFNGPRHLRNFKALPGSCQIGVGILGIIAGVGLLALGVLSFPQPVLCSSLCMTGVMLSALGTFAMGYGIYQSCNPTGSASSSAISSPTLSAATSSLSSAGSLEDQIVARAQKQGQTSVSDVQRAFKTEYRETRDLLDNLARAGRLMSHGHGKTTYYTVGSVLSSSSFAVAPRDPEKALGDLLASAESAWERLVLSHPEWIEGARQGVPRPGHPEGQIVFHVIEVLKNVDTWCRDNKVAPADREKLRLIAMIHDTFKHKVNRSVPKSGENHHAMIARRFAERIGIKDVEILEVIEHHDDAYNAYNSGLRHGHDESKAVSRLRTLAATLTAKKVRLELYKAFYWCDSNTGSKDQTPYTWFAARWPR